MTKVSPSILSADFANMGDNCKLLEQNGADYIHCDVMDGSFVEQITFGHKMVESVGKATSLPLDVHLMIVNPLKHIESFARAGSSIITLHYETVKDDTIGAIKAVKDLGVKAGMSIKPGTPIEELAPFLPLLDLVLIMSVEPGRGGQSFLDSAIDKIAYCKQYTLENKREIIIEVDGGINDITGERCANAGANLLVAGSYIFNSASMKDAINSLRCL